MITAIRKLARPWAVVFILANLLNVLAPTISWALTSGPTAPEATSFEPVDTTDMVNLATGDFTYNIPLLEVPGPAGGYPLSLSYHAGIQPNEDASWVGLGWTLNPGALNRTVSGYADDFKDVPGVDRSFWVGGSRSTYSVGVTVGKALGPNVSAGLTFSDDSNKGFGVGGYVGAGYGFESGANVSTTIGITPYGDHYSSTGVSVGLAQTSGKAFNLGLQAGASIDQDGATSSYIHAGVSYKKGEKGTSHSILGASLSSSGGGPSVSVGGGSVGIHNGKSGSVSTSGYDYSISIPISNVLTVHLGASYQRYWTDETATVLTNGSLYYPKTILSEGDLDHKAFDTYDLLNNLDNLQTKPDEQLNGSFADYDHYSVLGQGIAGSIKPYHYKSFLYRQNKKNKDDQYTVKSYPLGGNTKPVQFRFINDFSNRFIYSPPSFKNTSVLTYDFDDTQSTGQSDKDGYDKEKNLLYGSKSVQWFTNYEISPPRDQVTGELIDINSNVAQRAGFIDSRAKGFSRDYYAYSIDPNTLEVSLDTPGDQIGGFKITNPSGVSYHYALPVYAFDEYTYSGYKDENGKDFFNHYKRTQKYAYTWLLTTVTGPDFYDKNENGIADNGDYGYWVNFEYGKWTGNYNWRNPAEGYNKDVDLQYNFFSKGKKEVYYLNSIKTQSHTALFVKEIRNDAKGTVNLFNEAVQTPNSTTVNIDEGGFLPKTVGSTTNQPTSQLKLKKIYLIKNEDLTGYSDLEGRTANYSHSIGATNYHLGTNVLDIHDVADIENDLRNVSIKGIELISDTNTLAPFTSNSFISALDVQNTPNLPSSEKAGKLTLKSLKIFGRKWADLIPETKFEYELNEKPLTGTLSGSIFNNLSISNIDTSELKEGDLFKFNSPINNDLYYGYISKVNSQSSAKCSLIYGRGASSTLGWNLSGLNGSTIQFTKTKNPPYNKDLYDMWGMYKSDYVNLGNENVSRRTNSISSRSVDVWSLRAIKNPIGAIVRLDYEGDRYVNSLKRLSNVLVKEVQKVSGNNYAFKLILYDHPSNLGITNGQSFDGTLMFRRRGTNSWVLNPVKCNGTKLSELSVWEKKEWIGGSVIQLGDNFVTIYVGENVSQWFTTSDGVIRNANPGDQEGIFYDRAEDGTSGPDRAPYNFDVPEFIGGELIGNKVASIYGGDVRVTKLSIESNGTENQSSYTYTNGITSYEPVGFEVPIKVLPPNSNSCVKSHEKVELENYKKTYFEKIYGNFLNLFANSRELPPPGVIYNQVKLNEFRENGSIQLPNYSIYEFETYTSDLVSIDKAGFGSNVIDFTTGASIGSYSNRVDIYDYSSRVGNLKKITLYDSEGRKISETTNGYLHDVLTPSNYKTQLATSKINNQGVVDETFVDARKIKETGKLIDNITKPSGIISQKHRFPSVQVSQTSTNFKTGIVTTQENLAFDYFSGQVTKSISTDGYGNQFATEVTPAYRVYPEMGLGKMNMLTQEAASATFKVNDTYKSNPVEANKFGIVSASAQTWSDQTYVLGISTNQNASKQPGIWRQKSSFNFIGGDQNVPLAVTSDGLQPIATFTPFDAWGDNAIVTSGWQKNAEITKYDYFSHALEAKDINDHYAATIMSQDRTRVLGTAANGKYYEIGYSGAEEEPKIGSSAGVYELGNNIYVPVTNGATRSLAKAHTGSSSLLTLPGQQAFWFSTGEQSNSYHVSVWSTRTDAKINYHVDGGATQSASVINKGKAGEWYLLEADISGVSGNDNVRIWCESGNTQTYFDDFRVHPYQAAMTSYVYNNWGELTHILDNNNLYTEYRYDGMGRLRETYKESFQANVPGVSKISEINYNYGLKSPLFMVTINTGAGAGGTIAPSTQVLQGGEAVINAASNCTNHGLYFSVDGKPINYLTAPVTLYDGAKATLLGDACKLVGVLGDHRVRVEFDQPGPVPSPLYRADCEFIQQGSLYCPTGMYLFYNWNPTCGDWELEGTRYKYQLPEDIRESSGNCTPSSDCSQFINPN
ncbi:MAG: hypothetical protein ACKVOQ_23115 [Cyclobacteriaceae bacterium]